MDQDGQSDWCPPDRRASTHKDPFRCIERVRERLFEGEESVLHLIERIMAPLGPRVDGSSPWVDARLGRRFAGADQNSWSRIQFSTDPSIEIGVAVVS
jgi:Flp pilus assembly CpaF family ATPase